MKQAKRRQTFLLLLAFKSKFNFFLLFDRQPNLFSSYSSLSVCSFCIDTFTEKSHSWFWKSHPIYFWQKETLFFHSDCFSGVEEKGDWEKDKNLKKIFGPHNNCWHFYLSIWEKLVIQTETILLSPDFQIWFMSVQSTSN